MAYTKLMKAIYRSGTLQLLEPVDLPEGAEVWVGLQVGQGPLYPTRPQPPETLTRLIGLISVGGDALAESEALYDADSVSPMAHNAQDSGDVIISRRGDPV